MHSWKLSLLLCGSTIAITMAGAHPSDSLTARRDSVTAVGALWRSLLVPGWGQLYYGSVPKAVIFFGASASVAGIVVWNNARFLDADRRYHQYDSSDGRKQAALREREFYRDQRDVAALWFVAIYAFNAMDAYVGGDLASFPIGSNAHVKLFPSLQRIWVQLRW
jgi:hypothetical protein